VAFNNFMEVWGIFPEMKTPFAKKYNLVNIEMIINGIQGKRFGAIVLKKPGRLEDDLGKGRLLTLYRDQITSAIRDNYYLKNSIKFTIIGTKELEIYIPK